MHMAGEASRQISMMMPGHTLRVRVMRARSVMMSDVRFRITVMMMCVLSLMLLKSHQALAGIQVRAASKVVGMLVNVSVHIAVKMTVNAALHCRRLVMMLVRIQDLLDVLQFVLARALLLRQACRMIF